MSVLRERPVEMSDNASEKKVAEVLVRSVPENQQVANMIMCSLFRRNVYYYYYRHDCDYD